MIALAARDKRLSDKRPVTEFAINVDTFDWK